MRRIVIAIGSTLTGLVLLFSWPTSLNRSVALAETPTVDGPSTTEAPTAEPAATPDPSTSASPGSSDTSGAIDAPTDTATTPSADPTAAAGTYTGDSVATEFGPVQVQITVADGVVTSSEAVAYPTTNSKDQRINSYAIPTLNAEAVDAQSASIQMVSGATYTSQGYISSLQSALDQAGL